MSWKNKTSIITHTALRISAVFFAALILLTLTISQVFQNSMKDRIIADQQKLVETIADTVGYTFESLTTPIISLSSYSPTIRLLRDYDEKYTSDWLVNIRNLKQFMSNVNMFNDYILDIAIIQPDSNVAYSMSSRLNSDYDYVNQPWFLNALKTEGLIKYAPPHGTDHLYNGVAYSFTAIYPVKKADVLLGYILVEVDITRMADMFSKQAGNNDSGFLLVNQDGTIVFDYKRNRTDLTQMSQDMYEGISKEKPEPFVANHKLYIVKQLKDVGWYVLSETDYGVVTKPINHIVMIIIGIAIGCMAALLMIIIYTTKMLKRPFDLLIERIASYDGSSSTELVDPGKTPKEVFLLRTKFEEMADKINSLINDVYVAQVHKQEMELQILTNQINPHFLYNVLQLIQTKAVLSDNTEIEEMITSLGSMLRYAMERTRDYVSIGDEVDYIKNYLMFYKARFSYMFEYEIICEPELLNRKTIKFILQPVVENCFKHGFKDKKENGVIKINIFKDGDRIAFEIYDNGRGIPSNRLSQINEQLESGIYDSSIGIVNTHSRIRLVYGYAFGIRISSEYEEYTKVTISIRDEEMMKL